MRRPEVVEQRLSLGLDLETQQGRSTRKRVARVCVMTAAGYTRDGGAPTITSDCATLGELALEVERLKTELDGILAEARDEFEGSKVKEPPRTAPEPPPRPIDSGKRTAFTDLAVGDVMTRDVKTVDPNDQLSLADELMNQGRFRHVVVLDDAGDVAGVVSRRDVFYGALAWSLGQGRAAHEKALEAFPVKQVMNSDPLVVAPSMPLAEAAARMRERQIGCLPVVENGHLVGILTEGDFLALMVGAPVGD